MLPLKFIKMSFLQMLLIGQIIYLGHQTLVNDTTSTTVELNQTTESVSTVPEKLMRMTKDDLFVTLKHFWALYIRRNRDLHKVDIEDLKIIVGLYEGNLENEIETRYMSIPKAKDVYGYLREAYKTLYQVSEVEIGPFENALFRKAYDETHDEQPPDPKSTTTEPTRKLSTKRGRRSIGTTYDSFQFYNLATFSILLIIFV